MCDHKVSWTRSARFFEYRGWMSHIGGHPPTKPPPISSGKRTGIPRYAIETMLFIRAKCHSVSSCVSLIFWLSTNGLRDMVQGYPGAVGLTELTPSWVLKVKGTISVPLPRAPLFSFPILLLSWDVYMDSSTTSTFVEASSEDTACPWLSICTSLRFGRVSCFPFLLAPASCRS